jgi:hypothetical protein
MINDSARHARAVTLLMVIKNLIPIEKLASSALYIFHVPLITLEWTVWVVLNGNLYEFCVHVHCSCDTISH